MTLPIDARIRGWQYYRDFHNVKRVHKKLKADGYVISLAGVQKWCREGRWVKRAKKIDQQELEAEKLALDDESRKIAINLKAREPYEKKLDAGEMLNPQETHALLKINEQLISIEKRIWERRVTEERMKKEITPEQAKEVVEKFIAILREHPQVGAVVEKYRQELLEIFEQKMQFE